MRRLVGRRRGSQSGLFAVERPPRLVLRFAIVLSLAISVAAGLILFVVYEFAVSEAERAAAKQANLVASTLLQREVRPGDLARPVPPARRGELDELFRTHVLAAEILSVSLVREDGLVTYSTDHRAIGRRASSSLAREAAAGTIVSQASTTADRSTGGTKTLETFAPVSTVAAGGAALIVQSYAPIHSAARRAQVRIGGVLEILLLVLFLLCMPLLVRLTRRIKSQIDRIHFQAFFDELTELPNRPHLFERLEAAIGRAKDEGPLALGVVIVDLDRFREINDTLGHEVGDTLLRTTADRLRAAAGDDRLVARLGGDEFAVVGEVTGNDDAKAFAGELLRTLEPPVSVDGLPLAVDASAGVAVFPGDGGDAETLIKRAEIALYTAKEWRQDVLAYSPAVDPYDPEQLKLVVALREAAEQGQIRLHYQPKVDVATNTVVGFEALARWQHPTRGLLPPGAFIPIAERTGAIRHITGAVLTQAVEQLAAWSEKNLTLSVNLTAIDLLDTELPSRLEALVSSHDVEPSRLCIELTESTVMADPDRAQSILEGIAATGIRISIDDFGTGYSSLAYLKKLPVGELKIDRAFVSDMMVSRHDLLIVEATIQLAHSLGLRVVAEGVESLTVHQALRGLRCDEAQGYLYGASMPPGEAEALLEGENAAGLRSRLTSVPGEDVELLVAGG